MELLWSEGDLSAKQITIKLRESIGWNRTTTYTVIRKCMEKAAIERYEPNFMCRALISQNEIRRAEAEELVKRLFGGSSDLLIATLLNEEKLSKKDVKKLKDYIKNFK